MSIRNVFLLGALPLMLSACQREAPADVSPSVSPVAPVEVASVKDAPFDPAQIKMDYLEQVDSITAGQSAEYAVTVTNNSNQTLPSSGPNYAYVSYHWLNPDSSILVWENPRTPIQADIKPGGSVAVRFPVVAPAKVGTYTLKVVMGLQDGLDFEPSGQAQLHYGVKVQ